MAGDDHVMKEREHDRHLVEFPVTFAGDFDGAGIVYNLGMGGCKVVTNHPFTVGAMVALYLNIPEEAFAITIRMATVRWIMEYEFGVEFLGMEEIERERLARYLQKTDAAAV